MDTIIFNFTHKFQGMQIQIEAEVVSFSADGSADSDWDSMDYFSVENVAVHGRFLDVDDMKQLGLTDKEVERQFDAWVDTTRQEEFDCDEHSFTGC